MEIENEINLHFLIGYCIEGTEIASKVCFFNIKSRQKGTVKRD